MPRQDSCPSRSNILAPMSLFHFAGVIALVIVGFITALVVLFVECVRKGMVVESA